jgi:hypothetical protein
MKYWEQFFDKYGFEDGDSIPTGAGLYRWLTWKLGNLWLARAEQRILEATSL